MMTIRYFLWYALSSIVVDKNPLHIIPGARKIGNVTPRSGAVDSHSGLTETMRTLKTSLALTMFPIPGMIPSWDWSNINILIQK